MGLSAAPAQVTRPALRPVTLSANGRQISYRSQNGKVLTLELKSSSKAADTLREITIRTPAKPQSEKEIAKIDLGSMQGKGLLPEMFDTLSFWCMEAVEIAAFGPYDQPRK